MSKADLLPVPSALTAPYWAAAAEGRLVVQQCQHCGAHVFYPRNRCPSCFGADLSWVETSGLGTVFAVTVVYESAVPAYRDDLPYALAVVELKGGPRLMANIVNCAPESVAIGDPVAVTFERRGDRWLPQFEPRE